MGEVSIWYPLQLCKKIKKLLRFFKVFQVGNVQEQMEHLTEIDAAIEALDVCPSGNRRADGRFSGSPKRHEKPHSEYEFNFMTGKLLKAKERIRELKQQNAVLLEQIHHYESMQLQTEEWRDAVLNDSRDNVVWWRIVRLHFMSS